MGGKPGANSLKGYLRYWRRADVNFIWILRSQFSLLILLIPVLVLISTLNLYPYPASGSLYSDLTITHYPNIQLIKNSIREWRQIPLWSPMIMSGSPFAANPLSGLWYPLGWFLLLLPLPFGFNLMVAIHLIWAGLGTYFLLKTEGVSHIGALFAGLSFALLPKFFSHYGAGHLTLLFAIPWTPWLLFCQATKNQFVSRHVLYRFLPGLILSLIFLADIRWGVYAAILWLVYSIANRKVGWRGLIYDIVSQIFLVFIIVAPLAIPFIEYILYSSRSGLNPGESLVFSLPPANLMSFLFPDGSVYHEWMLYSGIIVFFLALLALMIRNTARKVKFWFSVFIVSIIISLGSEIPGMVYLAQLPLLGLLRVPARTLFITGLSLSVLAGIGFDLLVERSQDIHKRILNLFLFAMVIFVVCFWAGSVVVNGSLPFGVVWGSISILISAVWVGLRNKFHQPKSILIFGLFGIMIVDLVFVGYQSFRVRDAGAVFSEGEEAAAYLSTQPGFFRVYSPSYSIPQHTAVDFGLQLSDGVDPLQISNYVEYMVVASGVPRNGYSVTIPSFETGEPGIDNAKYSPDSRKLGLLNVGYVVANYDMQVEGLLLEEQFDEIRVYRNIYSRPRAWVDYQSGMKQADFKPAEVIEYSPNRISVSAEGPGTLVFSEVNYPGWWIWSKGELQPLDNDAGLFRSVELDSGEQTISLVYLPISLVIGILIFGLGLLGYTIRFTSLWYNRILNR